MSAPSFAVVPGAQVREALRGQEKQLVELVAATYLTHGEGRTVNPPSTFLTFPDRPKARIIALPASLGGADAVDGIKWISSVPANVAAGLPRASAVLILNDPVTGFPYACLESSIISAARTAASAALAADLLTRSRERPVRLGFCGAGLIARHIHAMLLGAGWSFESVAVHDSVPAHAAGFAGYLRAAAPDSRVVISPVAEDLIRGSDLVVFATVAAEPHVHEPTWFAHRPVVLHVSLRDLAPAVLLAATNIVDDVDHCLRERTSPHLTEQLTGNRDFVAGTVCDVLTGRLEPPADRPVVFSPFGLGVLDLAVGRFVHDRVRTAGRLLDVADFFVELDRYGSSDQGSDRP